MKKNQIVFGHSIAVITIIIWGITYISTKVLLADFRPIEILLIRTVIGYLILQVMYLPRLPFADKKQEFYYALAGLCGVNLYYLCENIALTYTYASNVGIIVSVSPFFAAIFANVAFHEKHLTKNFLIGFVAAIIGIALISFNGSATLHLNPKGDFLAFLAAILFAIYSTVVRKIGEFGHNTIQTTRRIFGYGLIFMLPIALGMGFQWKMDAMMKLNNLWNLLFLGILASAICFASWNKAVEVLGSVKTSIYIYLVPVITIVTSVLILHEQITTMAVIGTLLTLTGLFISNKR
ncbi:permease of the drug/metabolite transporter superfamily [Lachnospiraceae bacterium KM106-2]|nr:permease of the drug/metabolite transporter superfamily [Lachnospiraceae bacterium KM106-2]